MAATLTMTVNMLLALTLSDVAPNDESAAAIKKHASLRAARIATSDYPPEARQAGEAGTTRNRFLVDPTGTPQNCEIVSSSGSTSLDAKTCDLVIERFRFTPARDTSGQKAPEYWELIISWEHPKSSAPLIRLDHLAPETAPQPASN